MNARVERPLTGVTPTRVAMSKLATSIVVRQLQEAGFGRSFLYRTVGKLQEVYRRSPEKYNGYMVWLKAVHDSLQLRSPVVITLILPSPDLLMGLDITVLSRPENLGRIRQNYVDLDGCTFDLRKLPRVYPGLS